MLTQFDIEYIGYIANTWIPHRNDNGFRSVFALSKHLFPYVVDTLSSCHDIAYISIESSNGCALYNRYTDNSHYLQPSDRTLNVEFDDVMEDMTINGNDFKAISDEDSMNIVRFIMSNMGRHFVVHCRAGKSRSQAVCRFILDTFHDVYAEGDINSYNPCVSYNMSVYEKLRDHYLSWRTFYEMNPISRQPI